MEHPTISQQLERLDGGVNSASKITPAPKSDRYQAISRGKRKVRWGLSGPVSGGCRVVVDGFLVQALGSLAEGRLGMLCGMPILAVKVQHSSSQRSVDLWESQRSGKQTRRERRDAKIGVSAAGRTPSDGEGSTALHI